MDVIVCNNIKARHILLEVELENHSIYELN